MFPLTINVVLKDVDRDVAETALLLTRYTTKGHETKKKLKKVIKGKILNKPMLLINDKSHRVVFLECIETYSLEFNI